jgi:hypothetical protein
MPDGNDDAKKRNKRNLYKQIQRQARAREEEATATQAAGEHAKPKSVEEIIDGLLRDHDGQIHYR